MRIAAAGLSPLTSVSATNPNAVHGARRKPSPQAQAVCRAVVRHSERRPQKSAPRLVAVHLRQGR